MPYIEAVSSMYGNQNTMYFSEISAASNDPVGDRRVGERNGY
jgi:hypothetical protein